MGWWLTSQQRSFIAVVTLATVSLAELLALWTHIDHLDAHLAYMGVVAAGLVSTDLVPSRLAQGPQSSGSRTASDLSDRGGSRGDLDRISSDLSPHEARLR